MSEGETRSMTLMSNGALKEFPNNHARDFTIRLAERVVLSEEWGVALYSIVWHNDVSSFIPNRLSPPTRFY